jgi:hypothetical protein
MGKRQGKKQRAARRHPYRPHQVLGEAPGVLVFVSESADDCPLCEALGIPHVGPRSDDAVGERGEAPADNEGPAGKPSEPTGGSPCTKKA